MGIGSKHVDQIVKWLSTLLPVNEQELGKWLQTEYQEIDSCLSIPLVVAYSEQLSGTLSGSGNFFHQSITHTQV